MKLTINCEKEKMLNRVNKNVNTYAIEHIQDPVLISISKGYDKCGFMGYVEWIKLLLT